MPNSIFYPKKLNLSSQKLNHMDKLVEFLHREYGFDGCLRTHLLNTLRDPKNSKQQKMPTNNEDFKNLHGSPDLITSISKNGMLLYYSNYRDDEEIVTMAIKNIGMALQFASERLRDNKTIVFEAIKNCVEAFEFASETLRNDKDFARYLLSLGFAKSLKFMGDWLRNDSEIVSLALKIDVHVFKYASDKLRNNAFMVNWAIKVNGYAFRYASDCLRNDLTLAINAITKCPYMYVFASDLIQYKISEYYAMHCENVLEKIK